MSADRTIKLLAAGALVASAVALGGCSTSIVDLPAADAPAPKEAGGYLPVHDVPPDRDEAAMNPDEQAKIQAELIAARERQAAASGQNAAPNKPAN